MLRNLQHHRLAPFQDSDASSLSGFSYVSRPSIVPVFFLGLLIDRVAPSENLPVFPLVALSRCHEVDSAMALAAPGMFF